MQLLMVEGTNPNLRGTIGQNIDRIGYGLYRDLGANLRKVKDWDRMPRKFRLFRKICAPPPRGYAAICVLDCHLSSGELKSAMHSCCFICRLSAPVVK